MSIQLWTKHYRRVIGAALLIGGAVLSCAVTVAYAQTETQAQAQAQARPDVWVDELILDVVKKPYRLSEAMIVLQEDNRFYVPLLEMSDLLDFAVESEQARGYASGWAVSEDNSFSIDVPRGEAIIRGQVRALSPEDVMTADEYDAAAHDIFISTSLAAEIWPVTFNVDFSSLRLEIESEVPLPFEARKEREQKRAAAEARRRIQPTRNPDLPLIANPYRMFSLPAVDLETQYSWDQSRGSISGQHSVTGVMDLLGFSTNFAANTSYIDKKFERPENIRVTGNRKAFGEDDIILGFKEMQVGDTRLAPRTLVGNSISGRGAIFSTREIERQQDFDQITVEGQAQPGWETELYRNNELLDFGEVDSLGEYRFENVQLMVGNNTIRVVLYGPQGQVEERSENYLISGGMVRPGEFGYEIGGVDAGQDFFPVDPDPHSGPDGIASSAYGAYGVGTGLTVF
ncbi:MAG: hypothetical protein KJ667_00950, partial [Alphaproteobacteria bacterium]|nr:hypothetical protein [Alphaproteobacteria bacterium]